MKLSKLVSTLIHPFIDLTKDKDTLLYLVGTTNISMFYKKNQDLKLILNHVRKVCISNVKNIKLKYKMKEELTILSIFRPSKSRRASRDSGYSPKSVDPSNSQVQEGNRHSFKFSNKKFSSSQALGDTKMLTGMSESS
ncbi:hypothetical protein CR513_01820, partial [Mucuna pruriens]